MNDLAKAIKDGNAVLFVGAGISMTVGLPSWRALVSEIANLVSYDPDIFHSFGDYLALAEYYKLTTGSIGKLRSIMDVQWHSDDRRRDVRNSQLHKLLVTLPFPLIYTTNYDRYLEWACEDHAIPFRKITNVRDIVGLRQNERQIVKFHGDFDADESIVLTESHFFERLSFEGPLDIKLRADFLGKTVLFVGYSLSDINMRLMLYRLQRLWRESSHASVKPGSYIFLTRPNPIQETVLRSFGITPIVSDHDSHSDGLREFFKALHDQVQTV